MYKKIRGSYVFVLASVLWSFWKLEDLFGCPMQTNEGVDSRVFTAKSSA